MAKETYYLIDNTCDYPLIADVVEGELMVVLDKNNKPVWHYDHSDGFINISIVMPKDLLAITGPNPTFENVNVVPKRMANAVNKYLKSKGY